MPPSAVTFVDCWVQPVAVSVADQKELLDIDGARVAFFLKNAGGKVGVFHVYDATSGEWRSTGAEVTVNDNSGLASTWSRLTVRQDFPRQVWDLFVDGNLVAANLTYVEPLVTHTENYIIMGESQHPVGLDDLSIALRNPLGEDTDLDGLTDRLEKELKTNPLFDDRDADKNKDGLSDILALALRGKSAPLKAITAPPSPPVFSTPSGLLAAATSVGIDGAPQGGHIIYTTDGTDPRTNRAASIRYTTPITVSDSTILRAASVDSVGRVSIASSGVWLRLDQVPTQMRPHGAPETLLDLSRNGNPIQVSLPWTLTTGATTAQPGAVVASLGAAPIVSIIADPRDLFAENTGVYTASSKDLKAPCAVVCLNEGRVAGLDRAALSISGQSSRYHDVTAKHSLRVSFDESRDFIGKVLGEDALLAGQIRFRHPTHDSWTVAGPYYRNRRSAKYFADALANGLMQACGRESVTRRWTHVFLNTSYWGAYEALHQEDQSSREALLEGGPLNRAQAIWGSTDAWRKLHRDVEAWTGDLLTSKSSEGSAYRAIADRVDLPCLVDYIVVNCWMSNMDWPDHNYIISQREGRFSFISWDCEWSLRPANGLETNLTERFNNSQDGPAWLFDKLCASPAFRRTVEERIAVLFGENGPLGSSGLLREYTRQRQAFDTVLPAEAARWGQLALADQSLAERGKTLAWLEKEYLPRRGPILANQLAEYLRHCADSATHLEKEIADRGVVAGVEPVLFRPIARNKNPLGDADGDGLPDGWEAAQGFDSNSAADAQADADGDGLSNLLEFQLGTNSRRKDDASKRHVPEPPGLHTRPHEALVRNGKEVRTGSRARAAAAASSIESAATLPPAP
jgi:hypothetical protein